MPLLHCKFCHHEWEGKKESRCLWCLGPSYVLAPSTPLEDLCRVMRTSLPPSNRLPQAHRSSS